MDVTEITEKLKTELGERATIIDEDILNYVGSIIADSESESVDEIVEALVPFLVDTGCLKSADEVKDIVLKITGRKEDEFVATKHTLEMLDAPISLSNFKDTTKSDWDAYIKKYDNPTYVNQEALKKDEEKRRERLEKRAAKDAARAEKKREKEGLIDNTFFSGQVHHPSSGGGSDSKEDAAFGRDIHADDLSVAYGKLVLLENTKLDINYGRKYGLVGRNGCGKSTLLRYISHREFPYSKKISVLHVEQEVSGDDTTVLDCVLQADVERTALLQEEKHLLAINPNSDRLREVYQRLQDIDADEAEARACTILSGLSFSDEMMRTPTKEFSGGWRMRVSLARALFCNPDLLLLDEPTNHLDFHAVIWLEHFLANWKNTLVIVSHQRDFLNTVATDIIHLHGKKLNYYKGNYDTFEQIANNRIRQQKAEYEAQVAQRKHIQRFIDRFRFNAKRASLVQSRIKMMEKVEVVSAVVEEGAVIIPFPDPDPVPPPIMQFCGVSFGYTSDRPIFKNCDFSMDLESRIALVGPNGCGKTTLLKLLLGDLDPLAGHVVRNGKVRIGFFSQHFVDQLDLSVSAVDHFQTVFKGKTVQEIRTHLGKYGIVGDTALQTLNTLSGGQKSRVVFAMIAMRKPHILLLDEPSNHLDIETIEGLAQSLTTFQGGILMVSHDQRLISLVCDEVWCVGEGTVTKWKGDVLSYRKFVESSMKF